VSEQESAPAAITSFGAAITTMSEPGAAPHHIRCLVPADSVASQALFRRLRGRPGSPGKYELTIVGWPSANRNTSATFALNQDGMLQGSAENREARIELELTLSSDGNRWQGTAKEPRGTNIRPDSIELVSDTSSSRCSRP
jgi:hypothetical protein